MTIKRRTTKIRMILVVRLNYLLECLCNDVGLLNLLEMRTIIKQAICVSMLQMCCKTRANERKENLLSFPSAAEFDLGQLWK